MKTIKIKDKLLIGIIGQINFIALLVYFIFSINLKLNKVTEHKVQSTNEVNSIKELTFLTKVFLSKKIEFSTLKNPMKG